MSHSVYFGGSRHLGSLPIVAQVVRSVVRSGCSVHVGCQFGADHQVVLSALFAPAALSVFAVASSLQQAPAHVQQAARAGARVVLAAGGQSAPMPARFLLRSKAAFAGCGQAVFFQPGSGSLAVARECIRSGLAVFAFNPTPAAFPVPPAPVPSCVGSWQPCAPESYYSAFGLPCWQWQPAAVQQSLF